ncbi:MAG: glycosyltransferase [Solirubrobacterales bacterium]
MIAGEPSGDHGDGDLVVNLDAPVAPNALRVGCATAVFCVGSCFHRTRDIGRLEVSVGGARHRATACRMPRPDRFRQLHPGMSPRQEMKTSRDPGSEVDPELRSYRSGFWATVPIAAQPAAGTVELELIASLRGGGEARARIAAIEVSDPPPLPQGSGPVPDASAATIAICMATFEPDMDLFRAQVASLRNQTATDWICLLSDDCSDPQSFEELSAEVSGDPRFFVSRSPERIGFYRNFERALDMVPPEVELVALCDQDDRWYPEKLETLRDALGDAGLAYSDMRLVDASGGVLAESFWAQRKNNYTNLASMLVVNSITGAAMLLRRRVLELALPFPDMPGWHFHDHWLALVALAAGEVAYVDRPLYDYVQHERAVLGKMTGKSEAEAEAGGEGAPAGRRARPWSGLLSRWRAAYFCAYLRLEVQAQVLLARGSDRLSRPKRRALRRFVAAGSSPLAFGWLALRPARLLIGKNETLGSEPVLAKGILWRHLIPLRAAGRSRPGRSSAEASMPICGLESFGHRRLRRWRTRA